jgi:hypothetical protein
MTRPKENCKGKTHFFPAILKKRLAAKDKPFLNKFSMELTCNQFV